MATAAAHPRCDCPRHDDEIAPRGRLPAGRPPLQENDMITARQKAFRQNYRSRIVGCSTQRTSAQPGAYF